MDDNFRHYANIGNNIGQKMYIIFSLIIDSNVENMNIVIGNMDNMNNVLHPDYPYYTPTQLDYLTGMQSLIGKQKISEHKYILHHFLNHE